MKHDLLKLVLFFGSIALLSCDALAQGLLTPPDVPGPTMKSLDQIEARIPISSAPYVINASGSYYLTGNLLVGGGDAIFINGSGVTLDLNGYSISSNASPAQGTAILVNGTASRILIRNGSIMGA